MQPLGRQHFTLLLKDDGGLERRHDLRLDVIPAEDRRAADAEYFPLDMPN